MHRYTMLEARARVEAARRPRRRDAWIQPAREVFRRLVWKRGFLDGPEGWAFCFLSGLSEWVLAERHRRLWQSAQSAGIRDRGLGIRQPKAHAVPLPQSVNSST